MDETSQGQHDHTHTFSLIRSLGFEFNIIVVHLCMAANFFSVDGYAF